MDAFKTPILFLIFNRLETTKQVFQKIKEAKPKKLFIAADGPREKIINEKETCDDVRNYVLNNIDWDCEVKTLFRKNNLGSGKAVSEAITWFFKYVDQGIILEDDCLPNNSFFEFCEKMLNKYKDEENIYSINGFNPYPIEITGAWQNYCLIKMPHMWGWATWKSAWKKYDFDMKKLSTPEFENILINIWQKKRFVKYWKNILKDTKNNKIDTWDYQWTYLIWMNNGLCITPKYSLIKNLGFSNGTNTLNKKDPLSKIHTEDINSYDINIPVETDNKAHLYYIEKFALKNHRLKFILKKLGIFNIAKDIYNSL